MDGYIQLRKLRRAEYSEGTRNKEKVGAQEAGVQIPGPPLEKSSTVGQLPR